MSNTLKNDLLFYYPLESDTIDRSAQRNFLTPTDVTIDPVGGVVFDGTASQMQGMAVVVPSQFSFSILVKFADFGADFEDNVRVFDLSAGGSGVQNSIYVSRYGEFGVGFGISSGSPVVNTIIFTPSSRPVVIVPGGYVHIGGTIYEYNALDVVAARLYISGQKYNAAVDIPATVSAERGQFWIGRRTNLGFARFAGTIKQFAMWGRRLSDAEFMECALANGEVLTGNAIITTNQEQIITNQEQIISAVADIDTINIQDLRNNPPALGVFSLYDDVGGGAVPVTVVSVSFVGIESAGERRFLVSLGLSNIDVLSPRTKEIATSPTGEMNRSEVFDLTTAEHTLTIGSALGGILVGARPFGEFPAGSVNPARIILRNPTNGSLHESEFEGLWIDRSFAADPEWVFSLYRAGLTYVQLPNSILFNVTIDNLNYQLTLQKAPDAGTPPDSPTHPGDFSEIYDAKYNSQPIPSWTEGATAVVEIVSSSIPDTSLLVYAKDAFGDTGTILPKADGLLSGFGPNLAGSVFTPPRGISFPASTVTGVSSALAVASATPTNIATPNITAATRTVTDGVEHGISTISGEELGTITDASFTHNGTVHTIREIIYFVPTSGTPSLRFRTTGDLNLGQEPYIQIGSTRFEILDGTRTAENPPIAPFVLNVGVEPVFGNRFGYDVDEGGDNAYGTLNPTEFLDDGPIASIVIRSSSNKLSVGILYDRTFSRTYIPPSLRDITFYLIFSSGTNHLSLSSLDPNYLDVHGLYQFEDGRIFRQLSLEWSDKPEVLNFLDSRVGQDVNIAFSAHDTPQATIYTWSGANAPSSNPFTVGAQQEFDIADCDLDIFSFTFAEPASILPVLQPEDVFKVERLILPVSLATTNTAERSLTWNGFTVDNNGIITSPFYDHAILRTSAVNWSIDRTETSFVVGDRIYEIADQTERVSLHSPDLTWLAGDIVRGADGWKYNALLDVPRGILLTDTLYWQRQENASVLIDTNTKINAIVPPTA